MAVATRILTRAKTRIEARIWSRATVYVANELTRVLMEIVQQRGLDMGYMTDNLEIILKGLRTWTTLRHLNGIYLEVCDSSGNLLERHDLALEYDTQATSVEERFETRIEMLEQELTRFPPLPAGCAYRVVADLKPGAPSVPGWGETQFADTSHLRRKDIGSIIGTARIGSAYAAWL